MANKKKNYLHIPAVGQKDPTLCWAASLSWWLKAAKSIDIKQTTLRDRHYKMYRNDGTLSDQAMMDLINDRRYGMTLERFNNASSFTAESVQEHLAYGPVYVAFTEASTLTKHVNVIFGISGTGNNAHVAVMEPQAEAILDEFNLDSGEYVGKHEAKKLSEFNTIGSVYVGSLMLSL